MCVIFLKIFVLQWHMITGSWRPSEYKYAALHDDVIKLKLFTHYWPFVRGIHRWPVNSHKNLWRGALIFSLICINGWVNHREAGDLRRHRAHYDVIVMTSIDIQETFSRKDSLDIELGTGHLDISFISLWGINGPENGYVYIYTFHQPFNFSFPQIRFRYI